MSANYYCLVAGLRDYALDADTKGFDARAIIDDITGQLTDADAASLRKLLLFNDVGNLLNYRAGRSSFSTIGNFSREQIEQESVRPELLPEPIAKVVEAYDNPDDTDLDSVDTSPKFETALWTAYYAFAESDRCRFLRQWSSADRTLRNLTAALTARSKGLSAADVMVGSDDITAQIARSSAVDFGLKGELPYLDSVIAAAADNSDMLDKEHRIDVLRWNMAEELALFDYFNENTVLSYVVRISLVHRWAMLDAAKGRELFGRLVDSLSSAERVREAEKRQMETNY